MASIQCAIELYDGVSPVLRDMGFALERFSGRMTRFGEEMGAMTPEVEGLALFGSALGDLAGKAEGSLGALGAVLGVGEGIARVFSQDMFLPFTEGAALSTGQVGKLFDQMGGEIERTFQNVGRDAAAVAVSLPGFFAGPLGQIAGMFASMAASARASMDSVIGSANAAMGAVSVAASSGGGGAIAPLQSGGGTLAPLAVSTPAALRLPESQVNLFAAPGLKTPCPTESQMNVLAVPDRETLCLPEPEVYLCGAPRALASPPMVTVAVHNENHIGSEVDVETVLREMEIRLADAVASSMEGVYA